MVFWSFITILHIEIVNYINYSFLFYIINAGDFILIIYYIIWWLNSTESIDFLIFIFGFKSLMIFFYFFLQLFAHLTRLISFDFHIIMNNFILFRKKIMASRAFIFFIYNLIIYFLYISWFIIIFFFIFFSCNILFCFFFCAFDEISFVFLQLKVYYFFYFCYY